MQALNDTLNHAPNNINCNSSNLAVEMLTHLR